MMMADRRSSRELSRESFGSSSLQKRLAEMKLQQQQQQQQQHVPDLTDFMNDMFFGTAKVVDKKSYDLTGSGGGEDDDDDDFESSTRSSRQTQVWLEQAKRIVAASPTRCDSPTRLSGSPRFAAAAQGRLSPSSQLDRRDPLSRSARRHRTLEGFSSEILTKSAKHSRNRSEILDRSVLGSPTSEDSATQKWEDESNPPSPTNSTTHSEPTDPITSALLPPRKSTSHRRSRFQTDTTAVTPPHMIFPPPRRTFKSTTAPEDKDMLSPPKNLVVSSHRRTVSSGTCSVSNDREVLSPPRSLMESANRRSISSSTCSLQKIAPAKFSGNDWIKDIGEGVGGKKEMQLNLNGFLKEQKLKIGKVLNGDVDARAKIVLSAPSNSTSSMVAAICYAWLLEKRSSSKKTTKVNEGEHICVPVMNCKRPRMWKQKQAAWLFHHVGVDVRSLLFADEVDLESLMMAGKLNILVVGQDVLKTNSEVGSSCTILTDNFCEEAYDLLQIASLKKLLLAGILVDTKNLNASAKLATTRDAEAVQLLLVGSAPNYRNTLFDQLMQDSRDSGFTELLRQNYGKPPSPSEKVVDGGAMVEHRVPERKSTSTAKSPNNAKPNDLKTAKSNKSSPKTTDNKQKLAAATPSPAKGTPDSNRGKNTFFLAKWFGFGR